MRLRIGITMVVLCLYVGLFNLYMFELTQWDIVTEKLFYNFLTFGALLFALIDLKCGFVNSFHKQFNLIIFLSILANYVIIILTHLKVLVGDRPIPMVYAFDGTVFIVTATIFYNEIKYKVMND